MVHRVLLYISAADDLEAEREILGRAVAEIPVDIGWRIVYSPGRGDPVDLEAVATADVHLLLIGGDVRAPIGLEWHKAWQAGRRPVLLLKRRAMRTPAARSFVAYVEAFAAWGGFEKGSDLRRRVLLLLADHLTDRRLEHSLSHHEMERLVSWRSELQKGPQVVDEDTRGGAGDSSVILSKDRFTPSDGVLIRPDDRRDPEHNE